MKKEYLFIFLLIFCCGCIKPYYYSVGLRNTGNSQIAVHPIRIALDNKNGVAEIGNVMPGGYAIFRSFYEAPVEVVELRWENLLTKQKYRKNVQIVLPRQLFKNHDYLDQIIFIVYEDGIVKVLYSIWNNEIKDYIIVNSNGIEKDHRTSASKTTP